MTTQHRIALTSSQLLRAWLRDWGGILTLSTVGFTLLYAVGMFFQLGDADTRAYFANLGMPLITFVAAVLAMRAGTNPTLDMRTRWGWRVLALAFLANALGSTAWFIYESILQVYPEVSWADVFWLGFYPLLLSAVLLFPTAPRGQREQATFWLDTCTVLIGGGMLVWYFSIGPRASAESTSSFLHLVSLAYPIGDFVTMFALTTIALSRPDPRSAWPLRVIGLGLFFNIAANLGYAALLFDGTYQSGMWPSAAWALAFGICAIAAHVQHWQAQHVPAGAVPRAAKAHAISIVPYLAIAIGFSLLLTVAYQTWIRPLGDLILGCVILTGLVIVRQIVAVRENIRLAAERNADISAVNAQLAHASRLKDEFLASMSHELRTPLNTILGMAETVQEGVLGGVNAEQIDALRHIEESGRHLLALINDILDLSKVEAGMVELDVEDIAIAQVCQASVRLVKQTATQKRLTIVVNIDSTVTVLQADARRLKQMLVNLLSNAVKFTPERGTIGLDVVGDAAAQLVRLSVWDTGIGIAADNLPRLFQPFVQLDSRLARQYAGTGLGLALVARMAELHGGSVAVESTPGQGSRFTITLPWMAAPPLADPRDTVDLVAPSAVRGANIQRALIIENSPTAAAQLARYLRELDVEVSVHPCGRGALEAVLELCPDVILLDIQLPDCSGWDVLAQLKATPQVRAIPVVIASVVDDRARGTALGAAAYLVKPIARQQLRDALDTLQAGAAFPTGPTALRGVLDQPPALPAPVILLAEDEGNNIYTLSTYLVAKGYQVVVARNGAEALARAHDSAPALILMDIQMPGMDGLEAIRRIRADTTLAAIPIIALTALAMPGDCERCLAAGANEYLSKPVSLKGLVNAIEAHMHQPAASFST